MISVVIASFMLGSLPIQAQQPTTSVVPEISSIISKQEIKSLEPIKTIEPLQTKQIATVAIKPVPKPKPVQTASIKPTVSFSNTYSPGYCTYGVASWVHVPNNWGDASDWAYQASRDGYTVSNIPKIGAVAQSGGGLGHVALVIAVNGSTVTIKEMNGPSGLWSVDIRSVPKSSFRYIYL
jgi:surface antigen